MHRWQCTTPAIGPRGKKGRVGDPGLRGSGVAATPARAESSRPVSRCRHAGESLATSALILIPPPCLLSLLVKLCDRMAAMSLVNQLLQRGRGWQGTPIVLALFRLP